MKAFDKVILGSLGALVLGLGVAGAVGNQPQQANAGTPVSVTKSSFSAVSGTIDANITYQCSKGTGTNDPIVSSTSLKLYRPSGTNKSGNYITLTAATNFKITSASFTNSGTKTVAVDWAVDGVTWSGTTTSVTKSSVFSKDGLSCSSFSMCNADSSNALTLGSLSVTYESTVAEKTPSSIALTTVPTKTSYYRDEAFASAGAVVTATYEDSTTADVSAKVTWGEIDFSTSKVHASYTSNGVTVGLDYTITILDTPTYALVSSISDLGYDADVLIGDATNSVTLGTYDSTNYRFNTQSAVVSGSNLLSSKAQVLTLKFISKGVYALQLKGEAKYLAAYSSTTKSELIEADSYSDDAAKWTIAFSGSAATITSVADYTNKIIGHNNASTAYFACYSSAKVDLGIYQKINNPLTNLAVSGSLVRSSFYTSEAFDPNGLTVNATFDGVASPVDVSGLVSWPTANLTVGQTTVTGTFISGGVTKTVVSPAFTVQENVLQSIAITTPANKTSYVTGEKLDTTGLVVTATWASGQTDVTADCTFSPALTAELAVNDNTVTITYQGKTTSYAISVRLAIKYVKVTDVKQLIAGAKVYIAKSPAEADTETVVMSTTQNSNNRSKVTATLDASKNIIETDNAAAITIGYGTTNKAYYTLNASSTSTKEYLYAASSSSNYLRSQETVDANAEWQITITSGVASIVASGTNTHNILQYNSGSSIFSAYSSAQVAIALYVQENYVTAADHANTCYGLLGDACLGATSPAIASDNLKSAWTLIAEDYAALASDVKTILASASANVDGGYAEELAARYDYIMKKYGVASFTEGNFMSRDESGASSVLGLQGNESGAIITIASVGVLGLLTTAGVFLLKKKHN